MINYLHFRTEQNLDLGKMLPKVLFFGIIFFVTFFVQQVDAQNCSVNAGVSQTVCANQPLILQGGYTAPLQSGAQVVWSQVGGPAATIVNPTNLNTIVTNLIGGNTYKFRISTTCADGSLIYQEVTTHTVLSITYANAGPDAMYCPGQTGPLAANAPGINELGVWSVISGGGVSINNTSSATSTITITGGSSGPVTLRWTITNPNTTCSSYDDVLITNIGGISPVSAGTTQTLSHCYSTTQSTTLNGSYAGTNINGQQGTWSIVSGPNVPTFGNSHSNNTSVNGLIQGTYVFRWTVSGPCASGSAEVSIIVPAPTANITTASISGANQVFCDPLITSTVLNGSNPQYVNETVTWSLVSQTGGGTVTITNSNTPVATVYGLSSPNSYVFSYTINNSLTGCSSTASSNATVSYLPNPPTLAITTPSPVLTVCGTSSATISFTAGGSGTTEYRIFSGPATVGICLVLKKVDIFY